TCFTISSKYCCASPMACGPFIFLIIAMTASVFALLNAWLRVPFGSFLIIAALPSPFTLMISALAICPANIHMSVNTVFFIFLPFSLKFFWVLQLLHFVYFLRDL